MQLFMPTVYDDLAFAPRNYKVEEAQIDIIVREVLKSMGIEHLKDRPCYTLSGGEKRLVSIATVLTMAPELLILDEPSIALDPYARRRLIEILKAFKQTKIIATHDLDLVMNICQRTLVLKDGQLVYDGPSKEILTNEDFLKRQGLELPLCLQKPKWWDE